MPDLVPEECRASEIEVVHFWPFGMGRRRELFDGAFVDYALEVVNLFACIEFAEITEIVFADEVARCFLHFVNVEVACEGIDRRWISRWNGGIAKKVFIVSTTAVEACGEIWWRIW